MCLFDMCARVVFFSVIIMCVQFPFCDVYLCRWHVLSILVLREIPTCKKTNENERQNSFNCVSLLVCFHAFWMCFPFVVCSCVFSICVHVWCLFLWLSCVQFPFCDVYLCRWHVLSILVLREIPTCKKTNENARQNSFNCVSLLVCFHAFWMCFPFVVCSCVFSICVHVWCFFLWLSCVSNFLFATSICADDMCSRSWFCAKSPHVRKPMKMKDKILSIVFPFWCVFSCLLDVFSLCCVFMCLFDMCSRVVFFSVIIMCVQFPFCDVYLCRWHVLSILVLREIPACKKTNENERQNSFNCVSLLVCFHAFWMCFPFVVCSCVFSICVHVWCFFLWLSCVSNFLFATSICADDMCSRSWFCAKSPHVRKPMKMKDKILSIVFPFWCVFMPFGCVFPLLCVHVSFRYVFTCGVFFCDYHVCPISFLRRLFVQMTCALDLGFARNPHM